MQTSSTRDSPLARGLIIAASLLIGVVVVVILYVLPRATGGVSPTAASGSGVAALAPGALASLNAALNATSAVLLVSGYVCIRRKLVVWHKRFMLSASLVSAVFLVSYVLHHIQVGSVRFQGQGLAKILYLSLLLPHVLLAAAIVPLALTTLYRGLGGQVEAHRRIARRTLPLWLYVSASGVIIYFMLYRL